MSASPPLADVDVPDAIRAAGPHERRTTRASGECEGATTSCDAPDLEVAIGALLSFVFARDGVTAAANSHPARLEEAAERARDRLGPPFFDIAEGNSHE